MEFMNASILFGKIHMASIIAGANDLSNSSKRPGVKHAKKHSLKVDMTPMVDLGFLLISFFVITTELTRPRAMDLFMPHDGEMVPSKESATITILTGNNDKLFYYYG